MGVASSVGDVEFIERIGVGIGSGRFRARISAGGPLVSLMLADAEKFDKAGLMDWARRLKRVDHPGVPGVIQIEDAHEPGFVAQRFVEGETLDGRVERRGSGLPPVDGLALILQAAAALRAAHRNDIAHGALAARSLVLEGRDGAMDAVRLVGWRPLGPGLTYERAVGRDLRALGEFLYLALAGQPSPGAEPAEPVEPGAPVVVGFSDLADAWQRGSRSGPGKAVFAALAAARRLTTVDAFVDALLPEFSRLVGDAVAEVSYELSADREFKAEVQRQRDRQRELESKLRFIRDWLRDNAPAIEVVDDRVASLEAQERSLCNLEVELAMLLDRPVRPGENLGSTARARPPEPRAQQPRSADETLVESREEEDDDAGSPHEVVEPLPPTPARAPWARTAIVAALAAAVAGGVVWWAVRPPASGPGTAPETVASASPPSAQIGSKAPDSAPISVATVAAPETLAAVPTAPPPAPITQAPVTDVRPLPPAPPGMVLVPAGDVHLGLADTAQAAVLAQCRLDTAEAGKLGETLCANLALAAESAQRVEAVGAFYMDRLEVSQLQYDRCFNQRACKTLKLTWELDEQPATGVTWEMARQYCEHQGGRLPTAMEWLRAARGDDERLYAWGDEAPRDGERHRANFGRFDKRGPGPGREDGHKYAAPVGVFAERGSSIYGIANLSDNVREWTATETADGNVVAAGGGWRDLAMDLRVTRTVAVPKDQYFNDLGFRCVADIPNR